MSFKRSVVFFQSIVFCIATSAMGQAPRYRITDLGTIAGPASFAYAINQDGISTGWSSINFTNNQMHAFTALHGPMIDLGAPAGFRSSIGHSINAAGIVAGEGMASDFNNHALLWTGPGSFMDLGTIGDDIGSQAFGINDSGEVVGVSLPEFFAPRAFRWDAATGMHLLPRMSLNDGSDAYAVNNLGHITGDALGVDGSAHAVIWNADDSIRDLGILPKALACFGMAINSLDQVVGEAWGFEGDFSSSVRAFSWDEAGGMRMLPIHRAVRNEYAEGVNDSGDIVGFGDSKQIQGITVALLWTKGKVYDLKDLLVPGSERWESLRKAVAINNRGQIVGQGTKFLVIAGRKRLVRHAFVLTPI